MVDKDDDDGDSVAGTALVIVMYYIIQFSSQLGGRERNFSCFMDEDTEVTESKRQPDIPAQQI